jgi:UDP-N-acetylglucosamine 2-epimerase (non-hydrolysing)
MYSYLERYKELLLARGVESFRVKVIGNIIVDAIGDFNSRIDDSKILDELKIKEKQFILATLHREENITDKHILENKISDMLKFSKEKKLPVVFPIMPRTAIAIKDFGLENLLRDDSFLKTKPLGFIDFSKLEKTARLIVTDSGTTQEDGLIFGTPCVVARRSTERSETILAGATILEGFEGKNTLYKKMQEAFEMNTNWDRTILNPEGGSPSEKVCRDLIEKIETGYFNNSRSFEILKSNSFVRAAYNQKF